MFILFSMFAEDFVNNKNNCGREQKIIISRATQTRGIIFRFSLLHSFVHLHVSFFNRQKDVVYGGRFKQFDVIKTSIQRRFNIAYWLGMLIFNLQSTIPALV